MVQEVDGLTNWGSTSRKGLDSFNYKAQYDQITKRKQGQGEKQSWIPIGKTKYTNWDLRIWLFKSITLKWI